MLGGRAGTGGAGHSRYLVRRRLCAPGQRESLLSVHPAWSYRYRWGTARASTAAWGLLCRWGIAGAVYSVGDPYRVSRPILCDGAQRQAAPGDGELLRALHGGYPGTDMKW